MYEEYFQLAESPFNVTPDPAFFFLSERHENALSALRYGIRERKGFITITGEVGCGKTTLSRVFLKELDPQNYETALILNPCAEPTQLLRDILKEYRLDPVSDNPRELVDQIYKFLLKNTANGKETVLIIDEAQNLPPKVLEQVRLLSNLETHKHKLLQIVLFGQPELNAVLRRYDLRQLKQRILVHYDLKPLSLKETCDYIEHRLHISQGTNPLSFTNFAMRKIHKFSAGIPRIINNLCDKALLAAFVRNSNRVNYFDVRRAIRENNA